MAQLVDQGLVRSLADLYRLTKDELLNLDGFADRSASAPLGIDATVKSFPSIGF